MKIANRHLTFSILNPKRGRETGMGNRESGIPVSSILRETTFSDAQKPDSLTFPSRILNVN